MSKRFREENQLFDPSISDGYLSSILPVILDLPFRKSKNNRFTDTPSQKFGFYFRLKTSKTLYEELKDIYGDSNYEMSSYIFTQLVNTEPNRVEYYIRTRQPIFLFINTILLSSLPKNTFKLSPRDSAVVSFFNKYFEDFEDIFISGLGDGKYLNLTYDGLKVMNIKESVELYISDFIKLTNGKYNSWLLFYHRTGRLKQWKLYGKLYNGQIGTVEYDLDIQLDSIDIISNTTTLLSKLNLNSNSNVIQVYRPSEFIFYNKFADPQCNNDSKVEAIDDPNCKLTKMPINKFYSYLLCKCDEFSSFDQYEEYYLMLDDERSRKRRRIEYYNDN